VDRTEAVPACPELLHAAPRPRGPAAGHLHRMAAERRARRADRRHSIRSSRDGRAAGPLRAVCGPGRHDGSDRDLRRVGPRGYRHRDPGRPPGGQPVADPPPAGSTGGSGVRGVDGVRGPVPCCCAGRRPDRVAVQPLGTHAGRDSDPPGSRRAGAVDQRPGPAPDPPLRTPDPARTVRRSCTLGRADRGRCAPGRFDHGVPRPGAVLLRGRAGDVRRRVRGPGLRSAAGGRRLRLAGTGRDGPWARPGRDHPR
jgi:hypothetical protein